ncbi:MAG TPA: M28 family peptidase [Blastocatellia bacterium]|jgi:Zn-dependent M28 family amino/carboxypeptidase
MRIQQSSKARLREADDYILEAVASVSKDYLREIVEAISIPRHFFAEHRNNQMVARIIAHEFERFGYEVHYQGAWSNLLAKKSIDDEVILIGAHYDSVPSTPGSDDNASGIAVLLACAEALSVFDDLPVCFVAFNREEDGLIGSGDFVENYIGKGKLRVREAHILEMVGYSSRVRGSQRAPEGLPIRISDTGDFLGVLGNRISTKMIDAATEAAKTYVPELPVTGLKIYLGLEKRLSVLRRSDHDSFWQSNIPAVMWTDTAEFRNPNYHLPTDTPDTLDYDFMQKVARVIVACALTSCLK